MLLLIYFKLNTAFSMLLSGSVQSLEKQHVSEFLVRYRDGSQGHVIADRKAHKFFLLLTANKSCSPHPTDQ